MEFLRQKPSEVLQCALKLLSDRRHWVKGVFRVEAGEPKYDTIGRRRGVYKEGAYCAIGALRACAVLGYVEYGTAISPWNDDDLPGYSVLRSVIPGQKRIEDWNDEKRTTHKQLMEVFEKAVQKAIEMEAQADGSQVVLEQSVTTGQD